MDYSFTILNYELRRILSAAEEKRQAIFKKYSENPTDKNRDSLIKMDNEIAELKRQLQTLC